MILLLGKSSHEPFDNWGGYRGPEVLVNKNSTLKESKKFNPQASRTLLIGFSPEWGGSTRSLYTDVLVVREINCGD